MTTPNYRNLKKFTRVDLNVRLTWGGLWIAVAIAASCISVAITMLLHVIVAIYALRSASASYKALFILVIVKFLNPSLLKYDSNSSALFWVVFLVCCLRSISGQYKYLLKQWPIVFAFLCYVVLMAPLVSKHPIISLFKAVVYTLIALVALSAYRNITIKEREKLSSWIATSILVVILLSLPTYFISSIGFMKNGRGFQGILNHPQVFGVFMSPVLAFFAIHLMKEKVVMPLLSVSIFAFVALLIVFTQARTAFIASLGAVLIVSLRYLVSDIRRKQKLAIARSASCFFACLVGVIFFILFNPTIGNAIKNFAYKDRGEEVGEAFYRSRGFVLERHFNNFLASPIIGNGFGVFADDDPRDQPIKVMGIPISAATEKGFVILAVLEETGVIGTIMFFVFIMKMAAIVAKNSDPRFFGVFLSCLLVNFGEAVFFSPGGIGLYFWLLIGLSLAASNSKRPISGGTRHD